MNHYLLFSFFLLFSPSGFSQKFAFEYWHDGKIILDSGDTLKGQVKYNMQDDLVQFQTNGRLETYTARKIISFEIFDSTIKRYREFYTFPYAVKGQYKAPVFFELIEEGKMTMLAREALETKTYSSFYYYGSYTRIILVNKYFLLKEDGAIQPFSGKKNELLELMGNKGDEVQKYMRENKLDVDRKYDIGRTVAYYNSFFKR